MTPNDALMHLQLLLLHDDSNLTEAERDEVEEYLDVLWTHVLTGRVNV